MANPYAASLQETLKRLTAGEKITSPDASPTMDDADAFLAQTAGAGALPAPAPDMADADTFLASVTAPPPSAPTAALPESSALGAELRANERGVLPSFGGMAGMGMGAELGGEVGALGGPLTAAVGGVVGGLGGALLGATGVATLQDKILKALPAKWRAALGQDEAQQQADVTQHPVATTIGGYLPQLLTLRPGAIAPVVLKDTATTLQRLMAKPITSRVMGAGAMGGLEAGQEYAGGENVDPTKVAIAAGTGALLNKETALGRKLSGMGAAPVAALARLTRPEVAAPAAPESAPPVPDSVTPAPISRGLEMAPALAAQIEKLKTKATETPAAPPVDLKVNTAWEPLHDTDTGEQIGWHDPVSGAVRDIDNPPESDKLPASQSTIDRKNPIETPVSPPVPGKGVLPVPGAEPIPAAGQVLPGLPGEISAEMAPSGGPAAPEIHQGAQEGTGPEGVGAVPPGGPAADLHAQPPGPAIAPEGDARGTGDGTAAKPITATASEHIDTAGAVVNQNPTEGQKGAGNYAKAHVRVQGLDISIENPTGATRSGTDPTGKPWSVTMEHPYGYILGTKAKDGEHVDVTLGRNPQSRRTFVIDQKDADTGKYDEAKTFVGFDTPEEARDAYLKSFSDGRGAARIGAFRELPIDDFKQQLAAGAFEKAPRGFTTNPGKIAQEHADDVTAIETDAMQRAAARKALPNLTHESALAPDITTTSTKESNVLTQKTQPESAAQINPDQAARALQTNIHPLTGARPKGNAALRDFRAQMKSIVTGKAVQKTARPQSAYTFNIDRDVLGEIQAMGGIRTRDANGAVTKEGQDIHAILKDNRRPGLINNKTGMRPDQVRAKFQENGWFGRRDDIGADLSDFHDLLDRAARGGKVHHPESANAAAKVEPEAAASDAQLQGYAKDAGAGALTPDDIEHIRLRILGSQDPEDAVHDHLERKAIQAENEQTTETGDAPYEPEETGTDRAAGEGVGQPETLPGEEGGGGEARRGAEEDRGPPASEDGAEEGPASREVAASENPEGLAAPDDLFDTGSKDKQAIAAREFEGRGKMLPKAEQKTAGGLFAAKVEKPAMGGLDLTGGEAREKPPAQTRAEVDKELADIEKQSDALDDILEKDPNNEWAKKQQMRLMTRHSDIMNSILHRPGGLREGDEEFKAPTFFSALTRGIEGFKQERAPAQQWSGIIDNLPGIKKEEVEWSGVKDWLASQTGPVTKQQLADFLRANEVKVKEVVKGGSLFAKLELQWNAAADAVNAAIQDRLPDSEQNALRDRRDSIRDQMDEAQKIPDSTKFKSYTLPGGENYRELLLTLPSKDSAAHQAITKRIEDLQEREHFLRSDGETDEADRVNAEARRIAAGRTVSDTRDFRSGHFDEPNVLAHIRFDDRTGPNGEKILHIAEVQSDWHQKGRKQGYAKALSPEKRGALEGERDSLTDLASAIHARINRSMGRLTGDEFITAINKALSENKEWVSATERLAEINKELGRGGVPDAPFKTTWPELAMKRMLRYAAENGYDKLTWDTGEVAADRFDLSKRIHKVVADLMGDGRYRLEVFQKDTYPITRALTERELPNFIGKDLAEKIIKDANDHGRANFRKEYSGLDLKVGGEGMRGFYDKILPAFLNKYAKKWGAKVESTKIPGAEGSGLRNGKKLTVMGAGKKWRVVDSTNLTGHWPDVSPTFKTEAEARAWLKNEGGTPAHSISITNPMRDSVMGGQALFQPEGELIHAPRPNDAPRDISNEFTDALRVMSHETTEHGTNLALRDFIKARGEKTGTESIAFYDPRTKSALAVQTSDQRNTVSFGNIPALKDPDANLIGHHNHPSSSSLSVADIGALTNPGLRAVIAYGKGKDWYAAQLTAPMRDALRGDFEKGRGAAITDWFQGIKRAYSYARNLSTILVQPLVDSHKVAFEDAVRYLGPHAINTAFEKAGVITYLHSLEVPARIKGLFDETVRRMVDAIEGEPFVRNTVKGQTDVLHDRRPIPLQSTEGLARILEDIGPAPGRQPAGDGVARMGPEGARFTPDAKGQYRLLEYGDRPDYLGEDKSEYKAPEDDIFGGYAVAPHPSVVDYLKAKNLDLMGRLKGAASKRALGESMDRWRQGFQDRFLPLFRTESIVERQLGRRLTETERPYMAEELSSGRKGAKLEDLSEDMVRPLLAGMNARGISKEDLEAYLYARHAPERNARINEINPKFRGDLLAEGKPGSGMSDDDAAAILKGVNDSGKVEDFEALAGMVDKIRDFTVQERIDAGLLSQKQADAWRAAYKHYVPLRGRPELDPELSADRPKTGGGFNVKGAESYRAFGRTTEARDILAYTIMQAEESIIRGENNRIAQAFYNLAKAAPNKDFWKVDKIETKAVWNKAKNQVEYQPQNRILAEDKDFTVSTKIDGVEHRVTLNKNSERAVRLADSIKGLSGDQVSVLVKNFGILNRFLSHVNTTLNPEFVVTNALRDVQDAMANIQQFDMKGITAGILKDWPHAIKAAMQSAFGKEEGAWGGHAKAFRQAGGRVYFNQIEDIADLRTRLEREMANLKPGVSPMKAIHAIGKTIENINLGVENGIRLAAFKNARERGMSAAQAASLAKNLTINFNRRGSWGPLMNALYLFYNASVQGTATMLTAMKSPAVRKVLGAAVAAGAALEMTNSLSSQKDKDGALFYDKITPYDKARNLIVMDPTSDVGRFIKVPLPYGYSTFFSMGRSLAELYRGQKASDVGGELFSAMANSFNPIGGGQSLLSMITPTVMGPVVDLTLNKDFAGRPIMPAEPEYGSKVPQSQRYWGTVGPIAKDVTDFLNKATGGDEVKPGAVDVSPEVLDYLFGQATGAAGSFYERNANLVAKLFDPTSDVTFNDIPFARRVVGGKPATYDKEMFYERSGAIAQAVADAKSYAGRAEGDKARAQITDNAALVSLYGISQKTREALSNLNAARAAAVLAHDMGKLPDAAYTARLQKIKDAQTTLINQFNGAYVSRVLNAPSKKPVQPKDGEANGRRSENRGDSGVVNAHADTRAQLVPAIKAGDADALTKISDTGGTWSQADAARAARQAGMPATANLIERARFPLRQEHQDRIMAA